MAERLIKRRTCIGASHVSRDQESPVYAAELQCGCLLTYEASTFVPDIDEGAPCRQHGFLPGHVARSRRRPGRRRKFPSGAPEIAGRHDGLLRDRPVATVHALRRRGLTLRLVAAAQENGLVDIDLLRGASHCVPARPLLVAL